MVRASATDVKNRFGEYMEKAQREPVVVKKTGREYIVLLSKEEYDRLQAADDHYWGQLAEAAEKSGNYVHHDEVMAFIRQRLAEIAEIEE